MRDPYSVLGVKRDADPDEIKAAWRTKAKSVHPDHNQDDPTATQRFAEIGKAYEVLKDPGKRDRYDSQRQMAENRVQEQTIMQQRQAAREAAERAKLAKANAERIMAELERAEAEKSRADKLARAAAQAAATSQAAAAQQAAAQAAKAQAAADKMSTPGQAASGPAAPGASQTANPGAAQAAPEQKSAKAGPESPEDAVSRIFGSTPEAQAAAEGLRKEAEAAASAREAFEENQAKARPLGPLELITTLVRRITGSQPPPEKAPDMFVEAVVSIDNLIQQSSVNATLQDGRDIRVPLEGGLSDGSTVRIKAQGPKFTGMQRGDVVATLRVEKSDQFSVDGLDIRTRLPITLEHAVLGCETSIEGPSGTLPITVPAWSGSDQVITIEGQGLPDGEGGRGNLLVELRVLLWEKPDEKVTDLMRLMREGLFL